MTVATIRQDILDVLNGQGLIGVIYDYERWANDWETFINLYRTDIGSEEVIRGWEIGYRGFASVEPDIFGYSALREHRFEVMGYYGVNDTDESAKSTADQAEDICDAFDADTVLHGNTYYDCSQASFEMAERIFGSVLCHTILIPLTITENPA